MRLSAGRGRRASNEYVIPLKILELSETTALEQYSRD